MTSPITRRNFVNKTSAALSLAALHSALPAKLFADHHGSNKSLGIALVGLGNYATNELAPALQKTEHCHLAGLVTGNPDKGSRYARRYNIPDTNIYSYETFDQIVDNPDIHAVYVVLPNAMHAEYSIRAAHAGKHVICEKPMAVSVEECQQMIDACKANNVTLNIGYRLHYDLYHDVIRQQAAEQPNGPAQFVQAEFSFMTNNPNQWRLKRALAGGGPMMDVGIYCIQAARYSIGEEPIAVTAREYKTKPEFFSEVEETIVWEMEFPSGAVASCNTSYNYRAERLHVAYRDNNATAELSPAFVYRNLSGRLGYEKLDFGNPPQQARHMDAIAQSIFGGPATTTGGDEGLQDMRIIEAIYKSTANQGARTLV